MEGLNIMKVTKHYEQDHVMVYVEEGEIGRASCRERVFMMV